MRAMRLERPGTRLVPVDLPVPEPGAGQVLIRIHCCAVCRTDLHVVDGELPDPKRPVIPGHEIVGEVAGLGAGVDRFSVGERVGVPWLGFTCGLCAFCRAGRENLCDRPGFTGYTIDGGYAEYTVADARYCFAVPDAFSDAEAAPLLCAGLIGFRALRKAGAGKRLGLYGFGAAAHIVVQIARAEGRDVYAFVRPGDTAAEVFARSMGAVWTGPSDAPAPVPLDAAILFAPVGALVPAALRATAKGGRVVAAGIHMSDIPSFPYSILWEEREVVSVANLTRADGDGFFALARRVPIRTETVRYPLAEANEALDHLRAGTLSGAAVLTMPGF